MLICIDTRNGKTILRNSLDSVLPHERIVNERQAARKKNHQTLVQYKRSLMLARQKSRMMGRS